MNDFAIRLKQAMDERGISASELSRLSGVGKNLLSYYINGKYLAKQDKVYMIAKALNIDPGWLMTGVEQNYNRDQLKEYVGSGSGFVKLVDYMSQEDYMLVLDAFRRAEAKMKEDEDGQIHP